MGGHQSFNQSVAYSNVNRQSEQIDPWARFYNMDEEDYIFSIDQMPYALKKMEQEEKIETKEREIELQKKKQSEKIQRV